MLRENFTSAGREAKRLRHQEAQADYDANTRTPDELVTDDKEILGTNAEPFLKGHYRRKTDSIHDKIKDANENIDTPGRREKYLQYRSDRATIQSARLQEKIDNSPKTFLSEHINRQRRYKLKQLNLKKKVFGDMSSNLEDKRKNKPEKLQKKIDEIIHKKVDAMYRKALREEMRRRGLRRHNVMKRADFVAHKLTPEMKKKITTEAVLMVRKRNIEQGHLSSSHAVDTTLNQRKVTNEYGRTIR